MKLFSGLVCIVLISSCGALSLTADSHESALDCSCEQNAAFRQEIHDLKLTGGEQWNLIEQLREENALFQRQIESLKQAHIGNEEQTKLSSIGSKALLMQDEIDSADFVASQDYQTNPEDTRINFGRYADDYPEECYKLVGIKGKGDQTEVVKDVVEVRHSTTDTYNTIIGDDPFDSVLGGEVYIKIDKLKYAFGRAFSVGVASEDFDDFNVQLGKDNKSWRFDLNGGDVKHDGLTYYFPFEEIDLVGAVVGTKYLPANYTLQFIVNGKVVAQVQDSWFGKNTFYPAFSFYYAGDTVEIQDLDPN